MMIYPRPSAKKTAMYQVTVPTEPRDSLAPMTEGGQIAALA
jgi:hypothetical protein